MPILGKDSNASDNFRPYKNDKFTLEIQDIEKDHRDLVRKITNIGSHVKDSLSGHIP